VRSLGVEWGMKETNVKRRVIEKAICEYVDMDSWQCFKKKRKGS